MLRHEQRDPIHSDPDELLVSYADAKRHLRLSSDALRTEIEDRIVEVIDDLEPEIGFILDPRRVTLSLYRYDGLPVTLTGPFIAIESVKDGEGNDITYTLQRSGRNAVVTPDSVPDDLVIIYGAGFGVEDEYGGYVAEGLPPRLKALIFELVQFKTANRGDAGDSDYPPAIKRAIFKNADFRI